MEALLARVEPVSAVSRTKEVALYARDLLLNDPAALDEIISTLEQRGAYEQKIAALMASETHHVKWVVAHLGDTDPTLQAAALKVARGRPHIIPDEDLQRALDDASQRGRHDIYRSLHGREDLANVLLGCVIGKWGDTEAVLVLPFCSPTVVEQNLADLLYAVEGWRGLIRRHPKPVLKELMEDSTGDDGVDEWWLRYRTAVFQLLRQQPPMDEAVDFAFDLFERSAIVVFPDEYRHLYRLMVRHDPNRFLQLPAISSTDRVHLDSKTRRLLARSKASELPNYLRNRGSPINIKRLLQAMPPQDRLSALEATGLLQTPRHIHGCLLATLPNTAAANVAREVLEASKHPGLWWATKLEIQSYLPYEETGESLLAYTRKPAAEDRDWGWRLYIANVIRYGSAARLTDMLDMMITCLRNEQNPVRITAIKALKPIIWQPEVAAAVVRLVKSAMEARDFAGLKGLKNLLSAMLRKDGVMDYGAEILKLAAEGGHSLLGSVAHNSLSRKAARSIYNAVSGSIGTPPAVKYDLLLEVATVLGTVGQHVPDLQRRLREVIEYCEDEHKVRSAIDFYLAAKATRLERAVEIFALDPSTASLPAVARVIACRRTDLLQSALHAGPGRFMNQSDGHAQNPGSVWILGGRAHDFINRRVSNRWTSKQHLAYLSHLDKQLDVTQPTSTRAQGIAAASIVPEGLDVIRQRVNDEDVVVCEAALAALASFPQTLPLLLSHRSEDRARVAIFAASQATKYMRPSELEPLLREALADQTAKVTSRKEFARMIATRLQGELAASILLPLFEDENTHKDVRLAMVRDIIASRWPPGNGEAQAILKKASTSDDPELRKATIVAVDRVPPKFRAHRAAIIARAAESKDDQVALPALKVLYRWYKYVPQAPDILRSVVEDMGRTDRQLWTAAAKSLGFLASHPKGFEAMMQLARSLLAWDRPGDFDMPAYWRLVFVIGQTGLMWSKAYKQAFAQELIKTDRTLHHAVRVMASAVDNESTLADVREIADLCEGRPFLAEECGRVLAGKLAEDSLLPMAFSLMDTAAGAHFARCFASRRLRSPEESQWFAVIQQLRQHPDPDVRMRGWQIMKQPWFFPYF